MKTKLNKPVKLDSYAKKRIAYANRLFQIAIDKELELDMDFNSTVDTIVEIKELIKVKGTTVTIKYIDFGKPVTERFKSSSFYDREGMLYLLSQITRAIKKAQLKTNLN